MKNKLEKLKKDFDEKLKKITDLESLDSLYNEFFSRKAGEMTNMMKSLKELIGDERKNVGALTNDVKVEMEKIYEEKKQELENKKWESLLETEKIDITQPKLPRERHGSLHPVTLVQNDLEDFFTSMGFMVLDGPELESEYYNFEAVNIPDDHPARDMQDTFFIKDHNNWVMRTHTSSVQVRAMQKYGAPLRMIVPGKVFRNEATDPRHEHTFHQLEGVVIDKNITFGHMKGVIESMVKHLYGEETQVKLRPKFYPFVEPGVNGEVTCFLCKGKGCRVCKNTGWLEIFGAGMIHPHVLKSGNIDPKIYQGFAFGFGLTRLVMLKYGIEDIRHLESGDLRFLQQF
ncbi:MAG: phenylalanine--tRNA ligase subunit alpha [Candidatus Magasanikbacteria bacterium]